MKRRAYTRAWLAARGPDYRASLHTPEQRKAREKLYNDRHSERRKEYYRLRRITKPAETLEKDRALRERKREHLRTYFRNYQAVRANDLSAYHKAYRGSHVEELKRMGAAWRERNPERVRENANRYRLRKLNASFGDCSHKIKELLTQKNCHWCDCKLTSKNREIDHVMPISRGGLHSSDNLVAACSTCNRSKGSKLPGEWKSKFKEAA